MMKKSANSEANTFEISLVSCLKNENDKIWRKPMVFKKLGNFAESSDFFFRKIYVNENEYVKLYK